MHVLLLRVRLGVKLYLEIVHDSFDFDYQTMASFIHSAADKLRNKVASAGGRSNAHSKRGLCWPVDNQDAVFHFTKPGSKVSFICIDNVYVFKH